MSLPQLLAGVLDKHGDSMQQAALLAYLRQGEDAQQYLETITAARLCMSAYKHFSKEDELDAARAETTLAIAKWVKEHPYATQAQTQAELEKQILLFKQKIQNI
ncbi:uncharacterized protein LOC111700253 isoform X1 [Eurytemora carolleeae]|uniref:uncharacterized protein LOC111700253 isoform X1 n=1 Tax=Eurytemora carolleeae TaxID=1294199 RepID=UPI000C771C8D|nr:uncharacterized protein LOC111700253 isoform X1 [Eurytemora carolleeae]|eukprot:XP_023326898.1 uncharacterized protein LOC111700253 isoform X1 [Eurytemora affinis]